MKLDFLRSRRRTNQLKTEQYELLIHGLMHELYEIMQRSMLNQETYELYSHSGTRTSPVWRAPALQHLVLERGKRPVNGIYITQRKELLVVEQFSFGSRIKDWVGPKSFTLESLKTANAELTKQIVTHKAFNARVRQMVTASARKRAYRTVESIYFNELLPRSKLVNR